MFCTRFFSRMVGFGPGFCLPHLPLRLWAVCPQVAFSKGFRALLCKSGLLPFLILLPFFLLSSLSCSFPFADPVCANVGLGLLEFLLCIVPSSFHLTFHLLFFLSSFSFFSFASFFVFFPFVFFVFGLFAFSVSRCLSALALLRSLSLLDRPASVWFMDLCGFGLVVNGWPFGGVFWQCSAKWSCSFLILLFFLLILTSPLAMSSFLSLVSSPLVCFFIRVCFYVFLSLSSLSFFFCLFLSSLSGSLSWRPVGWLG